MRLERKYIGTSTALQVREKPSLVRRAPTAIKNLDVGNIEFGELFLVEGKSDVDQTTADLSADILGTKLLNPKKRRSYSSRRHFT